jgi:hypothetical protein
MSKTWRCPVCGQEDERVKPLGELLGGPVTTKEDIDEALQQIYDLVDSDQLVLALLVEYVHLHKAEAAAWITRRINDGSAKDNGEI